MFKFKLQLFADGDGEGGNNGGAQEPGQGAEQQTPQIDYEKLAQALAGKQTATEDSFLRGYLRQQGLSKEEMDSAISAFKEQKAKNDPSAKNAELQKELDGYKQREVLSKKNVSPEDYDYVAYKASQNKELPFDKAVDAFLKENPRFVNGSNKGYRVDTGAAGDHKDTKGGNSAVNEAIRNAFRK